MTWGRKWDANNASLPHIGTYLMQWRLRQCISMGLHITQQLHQLECLGKSIHTNPSFELYLPDKVILILLVVI